LTMKLVYRGGQKCASCGLKVPPGKVHVPFSCSESTGCKEVPLRAYTDSIPKVLH
jgi:predicted RNA-binding Zn-ribbon protein involved in translation (DUF1610 family)